MHTTCVQLQIKLQCMLQKSQGLEKYIKELYFSMAFWIFTIQELFCNQKGKSLTEKETKKRKKGKIWNLNYWLHMYADC
jgi:hypothetical protein